MNQATKELLERREKCLIPSLVLYHKENPLYIVRGEKQYLFDSEGRRYLDSIGGIVTISAGHCHPEIIARVREQLGVLQHTTCIYLTEPIVQLAEKLGSLAPGDLKFANITNSGSEANEYAVTMARQYTKSPWIVGLKHGYHGGTTGAMALTAHYNWKHGTPHFYGVVHALQPNCYRCPLGREYPSCDIKCAQDIEETIKTTTTGQIAAMIAEPIQGVGGFIVPPKEYFKIAAEVTHRYGGVFISDEVQSGIGRTGDHFFGIQHWDVVPDVITMAKSLGNGAPIGAVLTRKEIGESMRGLIHFNTFGGNPISSTQALATIEVIAQEKLSDNAKRLGNRIMEGLNALKEKRRLVGDVRGKGLLIGLELVKDRKTKEYATQETIRVMDRAKELGVLFGRGALNGNVIRIAPPLCITQEDADEIVRVLDVAMGDVEKSM